MKNIATIPPKKAGAVAFSPDGDGAQIDPKTLPRWDLSDLYSAPGGADLENALARSEKESDAFEAAHKGKVAQLDGNALGDAIAEYEKIEETLSRVMSYAQLVFSGDQSDPDNAKFYQEMQEQVTDISTHLLFFTLELNRIDEDALAEKMTAVGAAHFAPWVRDVRAFRDYQLSDDLEKLLFEKSVAGRSAWARLFDETMSALRFPYDGKDLTESEILNLLSHKKAAVRKKAALSLSGILSQNIRLFALITNTLAKDKDIEDRWRGYAAPVSYRNLSNHVEDEVVEALTSSVRGAYGDLSHRYYALKAKWMGKDKLDYWDRNAPLPQSDDRLIGWDEARQTVLSAYGEFSKELAQVGQRFFDNAWIDAPARPGKASGAFAHPTVPSSHPYLLLNYQGRTRDVMTLAHELGHGVHQVMAAPQGQLMADTPLTLAETASVFGEMLTFRALLQGESDKDRRKVMLSGKVEDMLNTVVRQVAMFEFERHVHDERKKGELTPERLGDIWLETQTESFGPAIATDENYKCFWAYIPHFIHSPFYVYAYAFGDCLVNSLYGAYEEAGDGFAEKYLEMLAAGGTKGHKELLAPFNLDASNPAFWKKGLGVISGFIDELEKMG